MKGDRLLFLTIFLTLCSHSVSMNTEAVLKAKVYSEQSIGILKPSLKQGAFTLAGPCISNPLTTCILGLASVGSTGYVAKKAVGDQKQDGDWTNVIKGALEMPSKWSMARLSEEDRLCRNCMPCDSFDFADFEEYRHGGGLTNCLKYLNSSNPEFDIYKKGKLQMDFFDGFGLPGHIPVHAGLVITYPINDGKYVALHVDLATGEGDVNMKGTAETKIEQKLQIIDGSQSQWTHRLVQNCLFQNLF